MSGRVDMLGLELAVSDRFELYDVGVRARCFRTKAAYRTQPFDPYDHRIRPDNGRLPIMLVFGLSSPSSAQQRPDSQVPCSCRLQVENPLRQSRMPGCHGVIVKKSAAVPGLIPLVRTEQKRGKHNLSSRVLVYKP